MNKNCFRLIFSKAIGCLIPVAEICTAQRKPGQTRGASATGTHRWALKALPLALLGILPQAFAQIVIAPNQQANMTQSSVGVPVMEIADANNDLARHMTSQQVGTQLKNALAKLNAADNTTVNSLKTSPVTVKVVDASGKPVDIKITDASSLQQLHGMRIVTGEQALGLKPAGSQFGKSSETYITIKEVSKGQFIYNFTSRPPAALKM